jgi:pantoate--beta-alanine ligase
MVICHSIPELRQYLNACAGQKRGFVPTMGNLHAGHLALIEQAKVNADLTIASIFVNRLQFLPHEDFDSYPRTFNDDVNVLTDAGCDVLFAPSEAALYPEPQTYKVQPSVAISDILEGEFRPGFFMGVCTVVMKLFQCVQPDVAVFGKKDYQQLKVIEHMVRQFALPIQVLRGDTLRAADGLALSSRNRYLSAEERSESIALSSTLREMAKAVRQPNANFKRIEADARQALTQKGWQPDYLTIRKQSDLQAPQTLTNEPLVVLGAARLGKTRLIDNFEF